MKYLIIDERMREIEKQTLKNLGYNLIQLKRCENVYEEISSHTDIFCTKIKNNLIIEKSKYDNLKNKLPKSINTVEGLSYVSEKYPEDIKYNVCIIGNKAIHNFRYTDRKVIEILQEEKYDLINVNQGYAKCSIAIIDENSIITTDKGIYNTLKRYDIDIVFLEDRLDIKLLNENKYSKMYGFIGGAVSRIEDNIFISGDINKIDKDNRIKEFIKSKSLNIIDFKGLDVIDYGRNIYVLRYTKGVIK